MPLLGGVRLLWCRSNREPLRQLAASKVTAHPTVLSQRFIARLDELIRVPVREKSCGHVFTLGRSQLTRVPVVVDIYVIEGRCAPPPCWNFEQPPQPEADGDCKRQHDNRSDQFDK